MAGYFVKAGSRLLCAGQGGGGGVKTPRYQERQLKLLLKTTLVQKFWRLLSIPRHRVQSIPSR
jgi:hypothetical protein